MSLRIVYFGTPQFSAEILHFLSEKKIQVVGVVTQPDRPQGRSSKRCPTPVKKIHFERFQEANLMQPEKASNEQFLKELEGLEADLFVVVAFGQILSKELLSIPHKGCINIHTSLLPKLRGAAPIQRALLNGDKETGVSIQKMVWELDAGDVIAKDKIIIHEDMPHNELEQELCRISKPLLLRVLKDYAVGIPDATPQDIANITYAPKIRPEDREINWNDSSLKIHNQIRALSPRPGAWTWLEKPHKRMKIIKGIRIEGEGGAPGQILSKQGIIACGEGAIQILEVQPEGKKAMSWDSWYRGSLKQAKFF